MKKTLLLCLLTWAFALAHGQTYWKLDPQNEWTDTEAGWNAMKQSTATIAAGNLSQLNLIKSDGSTSAVSFSGISGFKNNSATAMQGEGKGVFSDLIENHGWYFSNGAQFKFTGLSNSKYYTVYVLVASWKYEGGTASFSIGGSTSNSVATALNVGDQGAFENWEDDPALNKLINVSPNRGEITVKMNLTGYGAIEAIIVKEQTGFWVATNPAAPTNGVVDDNANIFNFSYNRSYGLLSQYEYTLDSGFTWRTVMTKPLLINNVSIKKGYVGVRVKNINGNGAGLPLWSNADYTIKSPKPTPSIITIKVVLKGTPSETAQLVPAGLKYNKWGRFGITNDDRQLTTVDLAAYITGGTAQANGITYPGKWFTDGANVRSRNIKWTGSIATNAYWNNDSLHDAGFGGTSMNWAQVNAVVQQGWSLLDHGAWHGIQLPGAVNFGFNTLMNAAQNRNYTWNQLAPLGTQYIMRFGVVPSSDPNYHSAWEELGYIGGSSEGTHDDYPHSYGLLDVTNWAKDRRYKVHLRHFSDLTNLKQFTNTQVWLDAALPLAASSNATSHYSEEVGLHNSIPDTIKKVIDIIANRFEDHIWVCGLQEFYEYFETIQQTNITQRIAGDTLIVTLDQTYLNEEQRWRDMSLLLHSNLGISSVIVTGADDYSYNINTGLINIYKKKTTGYSAPPNAWGTGFVMHGKVPLKPSDIFMDNNYDFPPQALIDHDTTKPYQVKQFGSLLYSPYDISIDLQDWGVVVDSVKIRVNAGSGYTTKVLLTRNDTEAEDSIGMFTGSNQNKWLTFVPKDSTKRYVASRIVLRSNQSAGFGNEVRVYGTYLPYGLEQNFTHRGKPLKYESGANTHYWYFTNNVSGDDVATVFNILDTLKLHSIRNYGDAWNYQNENGSQWSFNPVQQGWKEDQYARHLKAQMPDLIYWSVVQGQTRSIAAKWQIRDSSQMMKVVVDTLESLGYGYNLYGKVIWSYGNGVMGKAWIMPISGKGTEQNSDSWQIIPKSFPTFYKWGIPNGHGYKVGDTLLFTTRHVSQLPTTYAGNLDRANPRSWDSAARMAYVWAARKGTNQRASPFIPTAGNNDSVGVGTADWTEISNEPDKTWVGYDDYLNGNDLGVMWSKVYDNNKVFSTSYGAKNADPNMKVSTSGLAVSTADPMRGADYWSKTGRGNRAKINVGEQPMTWKARTFGWVDNSYDIIQLHNYSYTGGAYQYAGNIQSGLPVELGASLAAADQFVLFRNKYAPYASVDVGEWGYDRSQNSPMNAPYIDSYTAEEVRGAWAIRTMLCYNAHGVDYAQWYRLFGEHAGNDTTDGIQFSTMSLVIDSLGDQRYLKLNTVGYYFSQMHELGDYVYDSTLREDSIYCYRFKKGDTYLYAIWAVERSSNVSKWKSEKAVFHERKGVYRFTFKNGAVVKILRLKDRVLQLQSRTTTVPPTGFMIDYGLAPVFVEVAKINSK